MRLFLYCSTKVRLLLLTSPVTLHFKPHGGSLANISWHFAQLTTPPTSSFGFQDSTHTRFSSYLTGSSFSAFCTYFLVSHQSPNIGESESSSLVIDTYSLCDLTQYLCLKHLFTSDIKFISAACTSTLNSIHSIASWLSIWMASISNLTCPSYIPFSSSAQLFLRISISVIEIPSFQLQVKILYITESFYFAHSTSIGH